MKKIAHFVPVLTIVAAALLCLFFDNNSNLFLAQISNDERNELFQTTQPPAKHKTVVELCPDGINHYTECQMGSNESCTVVTCPPETDALFQ